MTIVYWITFASAILIFLLHVSNFISLKKKKEKKEELRCISIVVYNYAFDVVQKKASEGDILPIIDRQCTCPNTTTHRNSALLLALSRSLPLARSPSLSLSLSLSSMRSCDGSQVFLSKFCILKLAAALHNTTSHIRKTHLKIR